MDSTKHRFETLAVHAGRVPDPHTGAVTQPITLATTFQRGADGSFPGGHVYTRTSNPNRDALEAAYAALEGGTTALAFSSGQAATAAVLQSLSSGDHVILTSDLYHGTRYLIGDVLARWGLAADFIDLQDQAALLAALRPTTRLIWAETPSNPQLRIADLAAISAVAKAHGALFAVDNTWATPLLQRPLDFGADVVMHSATKYFGGHSDVLGGALILREAADTPLAEKLRASQRLAGGVPSPFDCWLLLRSIPTMPARVRLQTESAGRIAEFLAQHPRVERVNYPGLSTHPLHDVAARQMRGFGGMLSFEVRGGEAAAMAVAAKVQLITRATSLGGVETLIEHRASVEGPDTVTPRNLLRFSVGLEHVEDLIDDLDRALGSS
ncbi:cystathionine gamma-synthase [Verrucomicrobia bacterium SCGC AG-212-E04]|nr:cystathionine gamma-synthase [Verrucomicrobia bacterium SCGC AG-212-E04]